MTLPGRLRLLSYNIQNGLSTRKYSDYFTRSWKHVVPVPSRMANLDGIAQGIEAYDIVALQEVDAGSLRSGFLNQVQYLADKAGFESVYNQANRRIGLLTQHSNAILSRIQPSRFVEHKLPGVIPGRGALHVWYGEGENALHIFIMHLALGQRGRLRQIEYLADVIGAYPYTIVMGDLNCRSNSREMQYLLKRAQLAEPLPDMNTFPSWEPTRQLDHILISPAIEVLQVQALNWRFSDHLPLAMDVALPPQVGQSVGQSEQT
jgi:endonuclease/exonuclease/phosphatase family metal-dependent hydrolase